jgi:ubiquinone/menaquinone biosynthesis C-methylase UbiE
MKTVEDYDLDEVHKYGEVYVEFVKEVRGVDVTFYGNWQKDFAKLIIELSGYAGAGLNKEWETVLDVGCAACLNLRAIDELGIFSRLIGVDHSPYLLDLGQKLHDFGSYAKFHARSSWDLRPIEDDDVDLLMCTHVLEHLPNEDTLHGTLKEFKRVLHPDGKLLIIIPCTETEDQVFTERNDISPLHHLMHTSKWWSGVFGKYFKSESFKARQLFKKTELRPDRTDDKSFSEVYQSWTIFRYVHK